jgi:hypothetical protein
MSVLTHPVELADAELDAVAGGALINVVAVDVVDINNNQVQVNLPVAAAVAVLGGAAAGNFQGDITQQRLGRPGRV